MLAARYETQKICPGFESSGPTCTVKIYGTIPDTDSRKKTLLTLLKSQNSGFSAESFSFNTLPRYYLNR